MLNSLKIFNIYVGRKTSANLKRTSGCGRSQISPASCCFCALWMHVKDRKLVAALRRWLKSIDAVAGWSVEAKMSLDLEKLKFQQMPAASQGGWTRFHNRQLLLLVNASLAVELHRGGAKFAPPLCTCAPLVHLHWHPWDCRRGVGNAYQCKNVALVQENKMIYIGDGK